MNVLIVSLQIITAIAIVFGDAAEAVGNILLVSPTGSPSHEIWNMALAKGLLKKGYNITMLSHFEEKLRIKQNFTLIKLEGVFKDDEVDLDMEELLNLNIFSAINNMYNWAHNICTNDLNTEGLKTLLNYPSDVFDLIVLDISLNQCFYPIMDKFKNAPVVAVTPFLLPPVLAHSFGINIDTSSVPYYGSKFTPNMSFLERIYNFLYTYYEILHRNYVFIPKEEEAAKKIFGEDITPLHKLERKISLLLANIDPVLDYPALLPPNIVPVGGLHARPAESLPVVRFGKNYAIISTWCDLILLGTNVRSEQFDMKTRENLLAAFSKLPQTILWKYSAKDLKNVPKNVIIQKWLPQNDILGHEKTVLFISHGGALSMQESMYHGVPVVGIPIFADQRVNIASMVKKNLGLMLDAKALTTELVYRTVKEILDNPTYTKNIQKISKLYRSQKETALERGIYWVEHVFKHGSVHHLNLPSRDIPTYRRINLDLLITFCAIATVAVVSLLFFLVAVCKFLFVKRHVKQD